MKPTVVTLTNGAFAENCYLVGDPGSGEAAIVDPGEEVDLFLARLRHEHWTLRAIWLTHAHVDHVAGVAALRAQIEVPVYLHPADRPLYDGVPKQANTAPSVPPGLPVGTSLKLHETTFGLRLSV